MTKAAIATSRVRDQSPTSTHTMQESPNRAQAADAATPVHARRIRSILRHDPPFGAWGAAISSDRENVDINALRELSGVG